MNAAGMSAAPPEIALAVMEHAIGNDRHIRARLAQLTAATASAPRPARLPAG